MQTHTQRQMRILTRSCCGRCRASTRGGEKGKERFVSSRMQINDSFCTYNETASKRLDSFIVRKQTELKPISRSTENEMATILISIRHSSGHFKAEKSPLTAS